MTAGKSPSPWSADFLTTAHEGASARHERQVVNSFVLTARSFHGPVNSSSHSPIAADRTVGTFSRMAGRSDLAAGASTHTAESFIRLAGSSSRTVGSFNRTARRFSLMAGRFIRIAGASSRTAGRSNRTNKSISHTAETSSRTNKPSSRAVFCQKHAHEAKNHPFSPFRHVKWSKNDSCSRVIPNPRSCRRESAQISSETLAEECADSRRRLLFERADTQRFSPDPRP